MFDYAKVEDIVNIIAKEFSPVRIIIFGSVARHEATDDSDLDILVVMNTDAPRHRRGIPLMRRLYMSHIDMDLIVVTPDEYESDIQDERSLINEIVNTGVVAFEA